MIIINFTDEMKKIIIDTYPKYGINETIIKLGLTDGDKINVQYMANKLKLKRIGKYFNKQEIKYLQENYSTKTVDEISEYLNKSKDSIIHKACSLGLSNDVFFYSKKDVQFLKDNYGVLSNQEIAKTIGKTISSVDTKISKLGLSKNKKWSDEEKEILKKVYPYYTNRKIKKDFFPNRSIKTIIDMAHKLNLAKTKEKSVKWYDKEDVIDQLSYVSHKMGRTLCEDELQLYNLPSGKTFCRYFGSYENACIEAGIDPNHKIFGNDIHYKSMNGILCLSKSEKIISDFLEINHIDYIKEAMYKDYINDERCGNKRFDWIVDNYFIEFFGMPEKDFYRVRMENKIKICKDHNINLIELYPCDLNKLNAKLHMLL